jgi:hypothetical protein
MVLAVAPKGAGGQASMKGAENSGPAGQAALDRVARITAALLQSARLENSLEM